MVDITDDREEDNFEACYNFHSTLTQLSVCHSVNNSTIMESDSEYSKADLNILQLLSDFKQLKNLKLYNTLDNDLTTFDIQDLCPKLTTLDFSTRLEIPDSCVEEELLKPISARKSNSLQNLVITFPKLTISYINYLKAHFPPGSLSKLWITRNRMDWYNWMQKTGLAGALEFVHYMSSFPNVYLSAFSDRGSERREIDADSTKKTDFFKMLRAFIGNRKVFCDANFSNREFAGSSNMCITNNKHISFRYRFDDYEDFPKQINKTNDVDVVQQIIGMTLKNTDKTLIGPEIFNKLSIWYYDVQGLCNYFTYALANCSNLYYFKASRINSPPKSEISAAPQGDHNRWEEILDPSTRT